MKCWFCHTELAEINNKSYFYKLSASLSNNKLIEYYVYDVIIVASFTILHKALKKQSLIEKIGLFHYFNKNKAV